MNNNVKQILKRIKIAAIITIIIVFAVAIMNIWLAFRATIRESVIENPSDQRLKDDIEDYDSGLAEVIQLTPKKFKWKSNTILYDGETHVGFIAQDVEGVMPEIVGQRHQAGYSDCRTLDQTNLTPALVNSIQELNTQLTTLSEDLNDLKTWLGTP